MEKISKLDQSTPFGGDDNAALIAELKRQGFKYVTGHHADDENEPALILEWMVNPLNRQIMPPSLPGMTRGDPEGEMYNELANRLKTDPRSDYTFERLKVLTRFLLREIYYITSNEGDIMRVAEATSSPMWRRAMMVAGKILSLDLGPVHGS